MLHVVLHVNMATFENFEAEGTEQVFCIFMDASEMRLDFWEEGRPVIADLRNQ